MRLYNFDRLKNKKDPDLVISRADWRFLLPNPNPGTSLCLTEGRLFKTIQAFSKTTSQSELNPAFNEVDLVAVSDPDRNQLDYIMSVLKPGASCYIEWKANIFFRPNSIKKKLEAAGFELIDQYMPKPDPDTAPPGIWIPLGSYGAINHLVTKSYEYHSHSIFKRVGDVLRHALWLSVPGLFINFPWLITSGQARFKVCSIARKPNTCGKESDTRVLKDRLVEINKSFTDKKESEHINIMIISGGHNRLNKVVLVAFNAGSINPSYIIKIPRVKDSEFALKNEVNTLHALNNDNIRDGIPRVLFNNHKLGFFSVGQTFIGGKALGNILNSDNSPSLAKKLTRWLAELAIKSAIQLPSAWRNTHIKPLYEELNTICGYSIDPTLINKTKNVILSLEIPKLTCEHRDFAPWNILVASDDKFGVLDWESSRLDGIPGLDLIYFITYLCLYIEGAWTTDKGLECYRKMLNRNTYIGNLFEDCFNLYATEIGLSPQSNKALRIITWITHLASVSKQVRNDKLFPGELGHDTRSLFKSLLEHEMSCL